MALQTPPVTANVSDLVRPQAALAACRKNAAQLQLYERRTRLIERVEKRREVNARRRQPTRRNIQLHLSREMIPADPPLRPIRKMADEILKEMSAQFAKLYSKVGRRSIAPKVVARNRQGRMAVHLYRSGLRPVPIAKSDGSSMTLLPARTNGAHRRRFE